MNNKFKEVILNMYMESSLKCYKKTGIHLKIEKGTTEQLKRDMMNISYYYVKKSKMNYIYKLENASTIDMVLEWLKNYHCNDNFIKIKNEYINLENKIDLEFQKLQYALQNISLKKMNIKFFLYFENFNEVLFIKNKKGVVEERKIQYIILEIYYDDIFIEKKMYNTNLQLKEINNEIDIVMAKYIKWCKTPECMIDDIKTNKDITCIVSPKVSSMLFHESIAHLAEADVYNLLKKQIKIKEKIGIDEMTVIDYPMVEGLSTNISFDDIGIKAKPVIIVKDGVFENIISNEESKENKNYRVCGFSRGSINNEELQIRMRNIKVHNGTSDLRLIEEKLEYGLYIEEADDGFRDGLDIYIHVQTAYLISGGKRISKLSGFWLNNKNSDFLESVYAIGHDGIWTEMQKCNKNGGMIYISGFAPSIGCKMNLINAF